MWGRKRSIDSMETLQELQCISYREKIKEKQLGRKGKAYKERGRIEIMKGKCGLGMKRWKHRVREKCKKNILVHHFVQEQEGENQEIIKMVQRR